MYQAIYRTFRPDTFDEVLGQEHIVKILKNQIDHDTVSHAYLFSGIRGTGKTTLARILAKGLNCEAENKPCGVCESCVLIKENRHVDIIELDAASNNGVDNIREIRESVEYPPSIGRKKVYIIDEVHMLSTAASNALLKTLEEPPEYVVFILATTEPHKLPATILSRCMKLDFRRIPESSMRKGLLDICEKLGCELSPEAAGLIIKQAEGSVRDALTLLDQCVAASEDKIDEKLIREILGTVSREFLLNLTEDIVNQKSASVLTMLDEALADGSDVRQLLRDLIEHYRNLLIAKLMDEPWKLLNLSEENAEKIFEQAEIFTGEKIHTHLDLLTKAQAAERFANQPRILLELCILSMIGEGHGEGEPGVAGDGGRKSSERAEEGRKRTGLVEESRKPSKAVEKSQNELNPVEKSPESPEPESSEKVESGREKTDTVEKDRKPLNPAETAQNQSNPLEKGLKTSDSSESEKESTQGKKVNPEKLWELVLNELSTLPPPIKMGCKLIEIDDKSVTISCNNEINRSLVEQNSSLIGEKIGEITGKSRNIVCQCNMLEKEEFKAEKVAKKIEESLGVEVKLI